MTEKLRLGPLPRSETVRLTVILPAAVKADLDRYAELFSATYGEPANAIAIVPHMLAAFMQRDRTFRRGLQAAAPDRSGASAASSDAKSSTSDTEGEGSLSR